MLLEEQKCGYIQIMIAPIVLVIVTAVQVNSQDLCPSVCQCNFDKAECTNLFSEIVRITLNRFHSGLKVLQVTGITRLEIQKDFFLHWDITSLTSLDLSDNSITKIWQRVFYSLDYLEKLDLSVNSITNTGQPNVLLQYTVSLAGSVMEQYYRITPVNISGQCRVKRYTCELQLTYSIRSRPDQE